MSNNTSLDKAERELLSGYEKVTGNKPTSIVRLLCKSSAERAATGEKWKWIIDKSTPNWKEQLHWG